MYQRCTSSMLHSGIQCMQVRHDVGNGAADAPAQSQGIVSKWRQKERLKTTAVALVLCLNIGVDPPDVIKISPCARLECWVDPLSMQPPKALETIGAATWAVTAQHCVTRQLLRPWLLTHVLDLPQARTCRRSMSGGRGGPSTRRTWTPPWKM